MSIDRQLLDQFENPTLTMLSLRVSPEPRNRLTLLHGLSDGIDAALYKLRRRLVEDRDAPLSDDAWHYTTVIAGTSKRATPHAHILVYTDGDVSRERFADVVKWFVRKCPYAPDNMRGNSPNSGVVSIRGNGDDTIPRVDNDSSDLRSDARGHNSQAVVYALTQLPHLGRVADMARDDILHSSTLDAFGGSAFRSSLSREAIGDEYQPTSEPESDNPCRIQTDSSTDPNRMTSMPEQVAPRLERQFISDYCKEIANPSPSVIHHNLEQNAHVFKEPPDSEQIVTIVRAKLETDAG